MTLNHAAIFVDGRYTVQVREQVDGQLFDYKSVPADSLGGWLTEVCEGGARIAYDPWLHTWAFVEALEDKVAPRGITLVPADSNPIDAVWAESARALGASSAGLRGRPCGALLGGQARRRGRLAGTRRP